MDEQPLISRLIRNNSKRLQQFPDKEKARDFIEDLFTFLFVCELSQAGNVPRLHEGYERLRGELSGLLFALLRDGEAVDRHTQTFFDALPSIYDMLMEDAGAILSTDPAARSLEEVLAAYPGFFATVVYRISHQLFVQGITILPRFFTEYAHSKTGIDIHPGAVIGGSFAIDHGTGVVIGETTVIGEGVKIYQGVTLGALNVSKEAAQSKRHPTIGNQVVIYAGATILGGDTVIGQGSIIGGNVWLTYSVPPNSVVYHKSEVHVKDNNPFPEPLNFVI